MFVEQKDVRPGLEAFYCLGLNFSFYFITFKLWNCLLPVRGEMVHGAYDEHE